MITEEQRANHNMHCINEIEHIVKSLHKINKSEAIRITSLLDSCFLIDDDVEYTKQLRRTYLTACQALANLNRD
jgi:tRNA uridine 5-carbamoylmethylation protein Kti12